MRMKVSVLPYHDSAKPTLKWKVTINSVEDGKRKTIRKFFETRMKAETFAKVKRTEGDEIGNRAAELDADTRIAALNASKSLQPYGKKISDAVTFYLQYLKDTERSILIDDAIEEFLAYKEAKNSSHRYILDLKSRLNAFRKDFGKKYPTQITARQIDVWLAGLNVEKISQNNYRRVLSVFFGFCMRQGFCRDNPLMRVDAVKIMPKDTEIFEPSDMALMLSEAEGDIRAYLAISGFAGLRDSEVRRLQWKDIIRAEGEIDLAAYKTKTAQARHVKILPVLVHYLEPFAFEQGLVCKAGFTRRLQAFKAKLEKPVEGVRRAVTWKHNGLRHSYGTYHYRLYSNADLTAAQLGHTSPTMLFKNYRNANASRANAEAWFSLHKQANKDVEFVQDIR
jgi:integrase